jgi:hypothetical protein
VGEQALTWGSSLARARRVGALVGLAVVTPLVVARANPPEDLRSLAPAGIVIVAGGCESEPVDVNALAAALRVEMVQEGVLAVDVAAPGTLAVDDPSVATVRLFPTSCTAPEVRGFEIADGATRLSTRGVLSIDDIDRAVRPRVAALVIAERLRGSWRDLALHPSARDLAASGAATSTAGDGSPATWGGTPRGRDETRTVGSDLPPGSQSVDGGLPPEVKACWSGPPLL